MQSTRFITAFAVLVIVSASSTLEAQLLSRPGLRGRIVTRQPATSVPVNGYAASGWYPYVIARGEDRQWIRETPIEQRPNRPLHFWGNTRRRGQAGPIIQPGTAIAGVGVPTPVVIPTPATGVATGSIPTEVPSTQLGSNIASPAPTATPPVKAEPKDPPQTGFLLREINR